MMYARLHCKLDTGEISPIEEHFELLMRLILALISKNGIDMQAPHNKVNLIYL